MRDNLAKFCDIINYNFTDINLLKQALTHPSITKISQVKDNYERLEFLGDKVLGLIISEFLIKTFPQEKEGDLSKRQAILVKGQTLSQIALNIKLDQFLNMSYGEESCGGKTNKNNLENCLEALIGAIYLDSNLENTRNFIHHFWQEYLQNKTKPAQDPITHLQEIIQGQTKKLPIYQIQKIGGSDHEPIFEAELIIPNHNTKFNAQGKSKKDAQRNVSKLALNKLFVKKSGL